MGATTIAILVMIGIIIIVIAALVISIKVMSGMINNLKAENQTLKYAEKKWEEFHKSKQEVEKKTETKINESNATPNESLAANLSGHFGEIKK